MLWDVDGGAAPPPCESVREKATLHRPAFSKNAVAFSPDGLTLVVGGSACPRDCSVVLLDMAISDLLNEKSKFGYGLTAHSVAFSPDGNTLATGAYYTEGGAGLWHVAHYTTHPASAADFDGDGTIGFSDFVHFAARYGTTQGDAGYDARFDLDGNGTLGFGDFLIFSRSFG